MQIGGSSINLLATVGAITLVFAGLLALRADDIKKVLAYSTVSQLGYMAMALGVGAWTAAVFHLFTHAFFKANLFLGSGSVAHAVHSFDMKKSMGGMRSSCRAPTSPSSSDRSRWLACRLSRASGRRTRSSSALVAGASSAAPVRTGAYTFHLVMGMVGAALTAAYMTRCIYLTFHGEYRGNDAHDDDHAHADDDDAHAHHGDPHESGPAASPCRS